ncbi:MAG: SET domain-containing protein [Bacteroidetes bacterium]|nr:MAG: SET domain-containing protein [Bacteroidota bacterium]
MNFIVKEKDGYKGLYSQIPFKAGETVFEFTGEVIDYPTRTSIQIAPGKHQEDELGQFINHACEPSCRVESNRIVALRDLPTDTEITFDYNENEDLMSSPFTCHCCGKQIGGKEVKTTA